jgi:hypothetical protein
MVDHLCIWNILSRAEKQTCCLFAFFKTKFKTLYFDLVHQMMTDKTIHHMRTKKFMYSYGAVDKFDSQSSTCVQNFEFFRLLSGKGTL